MKKMQRMAVLTMQLKIEDVEDFVLNFFCQLRNHNLFFVLYITLKKFLVFSLNIICMKIYLFSFPPSSGMNQVAGVTKIVAYTF